MLGEQNLNNGVQRGVSFNGFNQRYVLHTVQTQESLADCGK